MRSIIRHVWIGSEPTLDTERLVLRSLRLTDAADLLAVDADPQVTYFRGLAPLSAEQSFSWLKKHLAGRRNKSRKWMFWCIRRKDDGAFVGITMLRSLNQDWREYEVGYSLAVNQWGKGFAQEATRATLSFAFENLKAHRIVANCYPENERSTKLLERLGFRLESHQLESYFEHGEWQDNLQFALLDREANLAN